MILLLAPFALQAIAMFFDEIYFHRKRGLPLWERIGHPLDSLTVLTCYAFIYFFLPTEANLNIYIGLCAVSCLFITKDEFIHTKYCDAAENWLHSLLFVLHPITFFCAGVIWMQQSSPVFLKIQPIIIMLVMIYQIFYWSPFWKKSDQK